MRSFKKAAGVSGIVLILTLMISSWAQAQDRRGQCRAALTNTSTPSKAGKVRPPEDFKLVVWRYNSGILNEDGSTSFDHAHVSELRPSPEGGSYQLVRSDSVRDNELVESPESRHRRLDGGILHMVTNPVKVEMQSASRGEGIFERNQSFTFEIYSKLGYLNAEEASLQKSIAKKFLKPEQVTVIEATEQRTTRQLKKEFGKIPPHARLEPESAAWQEYRSHYADYVKPKNVLYDLKVGFGWLISGQVDNRQYPLALEAEKLVTPIDRSKFKFVFELGRAGQEKNYGFEETLRASLFFALNEVIVAGGRLEDAYIFVHAMDRNRAIVFKRKYRTKEFSRYLDPARAEESVLMIPLLQALELYDPAQFSANLTRIRQEVPSAKAIKSATLQSLIIENRLMANQWLNLGLNVGLSVAQPDSTELKVQIRDYSPLRYALAERSPIGSGWTQEERSLLAEIVSQARPPMESRDNIAIALERDRNSEEGRMTRLSGIQRPHPMYQTDGLQRLDEFLIQQRAIEIFAGPKPSALTQDSAEALIVGVFDHYLDFLKARGIADPKSFLRQNHVRFALTMNHAGFRQASATVAAKDYWYVHRPSITLMYPHSLGFGQFTYQRQTKSVLWESWSYDIDQISQMKEARLKNSKPSSIPIKADTSELLKDPRLLEP